MQDKKSFILYKDSLVILEEMTNEQAGLLFKAINDYQNGLEPKLDFGLKMAFTPFKNQFIRDDDKWEEKAVVNRENGKLGGRPKKTEHNPKNPNGLQETQTPPEKGVTVTVNDTVTVNVKVKGKNSIEDRESEFKNSLHPFVDIYSNDMLHKFFLYWTEKSPKDRKMKYEKQKSFDVSRRLITWDKNNFNGDKIPKIPEREKTYKVKWRGQAWMYVDIEKFKSFKRDFDNEGWEFKSEKL